MAIGTHRGVNLGQQIDTGEAAGRKAQTKRKERKGIWNPNQGGLLQVSPSRVELLCKEGKGGKVGEGFHLGAGLREGPRSGLCPGVSH